MLKNKIILILAFILFVNTYLNADKLMQIKKSGIIFVGVKTNFKPFGFKQNDKIVGFDIDIVKEIAKDLNVKIKFIPVTAKNRVRLLKEDEIDIIIASMTHKKAIDLDIDFSIAYFYDGQTIIANKNSKYTGLIDLKDKNIGVVRNMTGGPVLKLIYPDLKITRYSNHNNLIKGLLNKEVNAISSDFSYLFSKIQKHKQLEIVSRMFTLEPYAIGLLENESNLRDALNFSIQKLTKDGRYKEIYKKWFNLDPQKEPNLWP